MPPSASPAAMRCLCTLVLALAGCQPGPPQTYRPPSPVVHVSSWGDFKGRFFGAPAYSVEEDLDAAQAASEGIRAVLLALPQKERGRLLTRWLPAPPAPTSESSAPAPADAGLQPEAVRPTLPVRPKEVDLLTTVRGLFESQGSRDLALAAFFAGPEPVARARQRLRLPLERITLEKLAGRLPKRELRYAREARKWAGLYGLAWPVERGWRLSSHFGPRFHPVMGKVLEHQGVDIRVPVGTAVRAPAEGVVVGVREGRANGRWLELRHEGGLRTIFCHLSRMEVKRGQKVKRGQLVALSGETGRVTGPHLHYQVKHSGAWVDPVGIRASAGLVATPLPWESEPQAAPTQAAMH
ncbi:M23 family metallopeptidase [Cystobacter ferrugineus]|nr:M23 family metallopeptidase [Cystobacter ferrugineus]